MGSKSRLLPWISEVLQKLEFDSVLDAFTGPGAVAYLCKAMGKRVLTNDFLHFSHILTKAVIENDTMQIAPEHLRILLSDDPSAPDFIRTTFDGIFFSTEDLQFLDLVSHNIGKLDDQYLRALALSPLIRSGVKKQPRGVFTISGDTSRYDDGRRDMRLSLRGQFLEQISHYNESVFSTSCEHLSFNIEIFDSDERFYRPEIVYLDPPYIPKSDDDCYVKRYHSSKGYPNIGLMRKFSAIQRFTRLRRNIRRFPTVARRMRRFIICSGSSQRVRSCSPIRPTGILRWMYWNRCWGNTRSVSMSISVRTGITLAHMVRSNALW